jgi:hypothetical protein
MIYVLAAFVLFTLWWAATGLALNLRRERDAIRIRLRTS